MDPSQTPMPTSRPQTETETTSHVNTTPPSGEAGEPSGTTGARDAHSQPPRAHPPPEGPPPRTVRDSYANFEGISLPYPPLNREGRGRVPTRPYMSMSNMNTELPPQRSARLDRTMPVHNENGTTRRTIGERLQPTICNAMAARNKYARYELLYRSTLNIMSILQVLLGALTTGLAAALTTGKQAQISTTILGGLTTLVASYIARANLSGEPELSATRVKELDQFLRECRAFRMDHAHEYGTPDSELDRRLKDLRRRFEELLGNAEKQSSPAEKKSMQVVPGHPAQGATVPVGPAQPRPAMTQAQSHAVSVV